MDFINRIKALFGFGSKGALSLDERQEQAAAAAQNALAAFTDAVTNLDQVAVVQQGLAAEAQDEAEELKLLVEEIEERAQTLAATATTNHLRALRLAALVA